MEFLHLFSSKGRFRSFFHSFFDGKSLINSTGSSNWIGALRVLRKLAMRIILAIRSVFLVQKNKIILLIFLNIVVIDSPLFGDITTSVMASGHALTALDNTLASACGADQSARGSSIRELPRQSVFAK